MPVLKQKTVRVGDQKQTIALKKLKNDQPRGGRHKYEIVDLDTNNTIEDPYTNKREAMRAFRDSIDQIERGMESAKSDNGGLGTTLGSSGSITDPFDADDLL